MDTFLLFLLVGALAQAVDGALGMAYGVISSSVLLALGVPPAMASASVHGAEVFTTAASASSHIWHKNVEWRLFVPLTVTLAKVHDIDESGLSTLHQLESLGLAPANTPHA
jgi:uncharacterized membrane protein YfcA